MNAVLEQFSTPQDLARWSGLKVHVPLLEVLYESPEIGRYFKFAVVRNPNKRQTTFHYYDKNTKELVVEMFQDDFNLFGHSKNFKTITWL